MAYANDINVYVEDNAGDQGIHQAGRPFWLSPDVDIPDHPGEATQGPNDVRIRIHLHEEPILDKKVTAEVYVGNPSLAMSPAAGTKRIDPGNILVRPASVDGTEPIANETGALVTFPWTPSSSAGDVDGPGHRCLIVRAFPVEVDLPTSFTIAAEQHEAQRNIEILTTTRKDFSGGENPGKGTPKDPRKRDDRREMWFERLTTLGPVKEGKRFVAWAFDPRPSKEIDAIVRTSVGKRFPGFSADPPNDTAIEGSRATGSEIDPKELLANKNFTAKSGVGRRGGLFEEDRLLRAASMTLGPSKLAEVRLWFDHSNADSGKAVVFHAAQWDANGKPEGGMTIVALAPAD